MSSLPTSPKGIAAVLLRISFGVSLLMVGLTHYMTMDAFKAMTMDGLGALEPVGSLWALILPALMIVGGALVTIGKYSEIATWASGIALASVPIGMLLKPVVGGVPLPNVLPDTIDGFIWLIVFVLVVKTSCCSSE